MTQPEMVCAVVVTDVEGMCVPAGLYIATERNVQPWKVSHFISGRSNLLRCAKSNGLLKIRTHLTKCRKSQPWIVAFRTMFLDVHLWFPCGNLHQFATVKAKNVLGNMAEPSSSWFKFTLTYTENRLHGGDGAEKSDAYGFVWKFGGPNRFSVDQHPLKLSSWHKLKESGHSTGIPHRYPPKNYSFPNIPNLSQSHESPSRQQFSARDMGPLERLLLLGNDGSPVQALLQDCFQIVTINVTGTFMVTGLFSYLNFNSWLCVKFYAIVKLLYFAWSPPWRLYILLLANLLAFYLTFYLAFYLAYLLAFYLAYLLAFYLAYLLAYLLAFYLAFYLAYLLGYYLANLLAFYLENLYLAYLLAFYLAYLLAFYLAYLLAYVLAYLLAFYLAYLLAFYLAYLLAFYLTFYLRHIFWHIFWHSIWHSIWHIFWHSIWPLRSSGAHWAGQVPGWGPAVHTELGRSQVEVQQYTLSWAGPRLRSSGAHWAGQIPGWGPAVYTELERSQVEVQRCTLSWEVGKELGAESRRRELAKSWAKSWQGGSAGGSWCRHGRGETGGGGEEEDEEEEDSWSRRRRRTRRRTRTRRKSALIKSNYFTSSDPHHDIYTF